MIPNKCLLIPKGRRHLCFGCTLGKAIKMLFLEEYFDAIETTVKRALADMLRRGEIRKIGSGKLTGYARVE